MTDETRQGVERQYKPLTARYCLEIVIDEPQEGQPDGKFVSDVRLEYGHDRMPHVMTRLHFGDVPALMSYEELCFVRQQMRSSFHHVDGFTVLGYPYDDPTVAEGYADIYGVPDRNRRNKGQQ